jgi:hypothetical protein
MRWATEDLRQAMRHEQHAGARGADHGHQVEHAVDPGGVECRRGLVEDEQAWLGGDRAHDLDDAGRPGRSGCLGVGEGIVPNPYSARIPLVHFAMSLYAGLSEAGVPM